MLVLSNQLSVLELTRLVLTLTGDDNGKRRPIAFNVYCGDGAIVKWNRINPYGQPDIVHEIGNLIDKCPEDVK